MNFFVHSKCKRSSLRSQCWMRLFLWFSNTVDRVSFLWLVQTTSRKLPFSISLIQDIIRGRLGNDVGRRNSCAQITTIESADDLSSSSQTTSKRRRSSLAQLSELFKDWGISHPGSKSNKNQSQNVTAAETQRRGTLADLGRTFGCKNKRQLTSTASVVQPPNVEPDFMSKIRKRRETSADITVLRKGSGTTTDLKSDISR